MFFRYDSSAVRLTGRWAPLGEYTATTAPGSSIEVAFAGAMATLQFDLTCMAEPRPHLWISVDAGARVEVPVDRYLRVYGVGEGLHVVRIIYKGSVERQHRWHHPLVGRIAFLGFDAEREGLLPLDARRTIEFVGDSITEGVLIDDFCQPEKDVQNNRPYQDDVTATYAWLTAEALNLNPLFMGYGAVGVTKGGQGGVPKASEAYPYCFERAPVAYPSPNYILINHGANDRGRSESEYLQGYRELLDVILARNPFSKIILLSAFSGVYVQALENFARVYEKEKGHPLFFVDSSGWIPPEPLHPRREGHRIIAEHLIPILRKQFAL